jgi:hypothetical protein
MTYEDDGRSPWAPALDVAARLSFQAYCITGGDRGGDNRNEINSGDMEILKAAIRRDETPRYVRHALEVANAAYGDAIIQYSHRGGGRSGPPAPPWKP